MAFKTIFSTDSDRELAFSIREVLGDGEQTMFRQLLIDTISAHIEDLYKGETDE